MINLQFIKERIERRIKYLKFKLRKFINYKIVNWGYYPRYTVMQDNDEYVVYKEIMRYDNIEDALNTAVDVNCYCTLEPYLVMQRSMLTYEEHKERLVEPEVKGFIGWIFKILK